MDGRRRVKLVILITPTPLDSLYPNVPAILHAPDTHGISSTFLRSSFHHRVLRRVTISRQIEKTGLYPSLFTESELKCDTKQDHGDSSHAYSWQGLPIVYSTCLRHSSTHAHTDMGVWCHAVGWVHPGVQGDRWSICSLHKLFLAWLPVLRQNVLKSLFLCNQKYSR